MEDLDIIIEAAKEQMEKAIQHLQHELVKIRAGKANPMMLDGILVEYYGAMTPLNQVSNINTPDARTIMIQPWEKKMLEPIQKAILNSNIGLTPQNNGEVVILNIPPLTEERRKQLVKQAKAEGEHAKIAIRNARKEANDEIKKMQKEGLPEDLCKDAEENVQKLTDEFIAKVDKLIEIKEKEILTV
ncbi:MAG: ribosome-recycling factor [Vicingaceae bacterium]|jgi:ribosome recycling factor|nr:MAG: ribosome-recycling factor [Vicingaceae bacterium]